MKYFIIHGTGGSPKGNWFPWLKQNLEEKGHNVSVPSFPTPENQSVDSWLEVFKEHLNEMDNNTILIGHSLGPAFILSILEKINVKVKGVITVAGFLGLIGNEEFDNLNQSFTTKQFN
jgi:predicted alpha/beta hydrolase family esterase